MFSTFLNKLHFYQLYFNVAFTVLSTPLGSLSEKHRELSSSSIYAAGYPVLLSFASLM